MNYSRQMDVNKARRFPQANTTRTLPNANEITRSLIDNVIQPIVDGLRQASYSNVTNQINERDGGRFAAKRDWFSNEECCSQPDPCHCSCCIVDADLLIYARLGERRVIPLIIENRWRRDRKIRVELSSWSTRGGTQANVTAHLVPPGPELIVAPCSRQEIVMVVEVVGGEENKEGFQDVDNCVVYYSDMRIEGCEIRPIRIALAVLPRDCEAYQINCGCKCC